jgi:hypothetical protein
MIKPEFFDSTSLGVCSIEARLLFVALWVFGNDYGNMKVDLSRIRKNAFFYDRMSDADVLGLLCELEAADCIRGYAVDGKPYVNVPNFNVYQTVRKPNKSNVPDLEGEYPEHTDFFMTWKQCGLNDALEQYQCVTSTVPTEKNASTAPVPHQYDTSNAKRKKERKKEVTSSSKEELVTERKVARVAAADESAPRATKMVCPDCGEPMRRTNTRVSGTERHYWRCETCMVDLPEPK